MCVHLATPVRARRRSLSDSFRGGGCAPGPASTISSCPSPCMHRAPALTAVSEFQHGELLRARRGAESHAGAPRAATEGARHVRSRRRCTALGPRRPKGVAPAAGECPRHAVGRMKSVEDFFFREDLWQSDLEFQFRPFQQVSFVEKKGREKKRVRVFNRPVFDPEIPV